MVSAQRSHRTNRACLSRAELAMSEAQTKAKSTKTADEREPVWSPGLPARQKVRPRLRITPVLITLVMVALAVPLGWAMWDAYMGAAWTRDGTVRVYVVDEVPEGVVLVDGMTAKVQIDPRPRPQAK